VETVSGLKAILGRFVSGSKNPVSPMQIDLGQGQNGSDGFRPDKARGQIDISSSSRAQAFVIQ
jgi:hypothetical protein